MSVSEASEIVAGCKRLEKKKKLEPSSLGAPESVLSNAIGLYTLCHCQTIPTSGRATILQRAYPTRSGWAGSGPTLGLTAGSPVRRASLSHHHSSDDDGVSTDTSIQDKPLHRRHGSRGSQNNCSGSDSDDTPMISEG